MCGFGLTLVDSGWRVQVASEPIDALSVILYTQSKEQVP